MLTFWFNRSVNFKSRLGEWLDEKGMKEEALMGMECWRFRADAGVERGGSGREGGVWVLGGQEGAR